MQPSCWLNRTIGYGIIHIMIELGVVPRDPSRPLCGQRENCNICCNQQSPLIGVKDAEKITALIETMDEPVVRRLLRASIERLQKRKIDAGKLHDKIIISGESLFSEKNTKKAWQYFEENPVKRMHLEMQKNLPIHAILRQLAVHSAELCQRSGDAKQTILQEIRSDEDHPLRYTRIRLAGSRKPVVDIETMAEFEWLLGKWVLQRMFKTGRRVIGDEVMSIKAEELVFFAQFLLESDILNDPCPAVNPKSGLCDIYAAEPTLCREIGGEADSLDVAVAGCGANSAHCIRNGLVFGNSKIATGRITTSLGRSGKAEYTSVDFLLLVECSRKLQKEKGGQIKGVTTNDLLAL